MIELKIQASSPDMLRDTLLAFSAVMQSGLIAPSDQVTMTATDTDAPAGTTEIEAWIDQAPDPEPEPEPAPAPRKRGRPRKVEPVQDVEPDPEVVTEEDEPEAEGAVEPPPPPPPPPPALVAVKPRPVKAEPIVYTRDDLRAAVNRVMVTHSTREATNRLKTLGYKKSSDVPDDDFERAINVLLGA